MSKSLQLMLDISDGPLFRFAFWVMVLAGIRALFLGASDALGAYLTTPDRQDFWQKIRLRLLWFTMPSVILRRSGLGGSNTMHRFQTGLFATSLVFRLTVVILPAFMIEHVYIWEKALGIRWGTLSATAADTLSIIAIVAGFILFLGRLYSPVLRKIEAPWTFLKPLILIIPLVSGMLAMHPEWSPIDYYVLRLIHGLSAAAVFLLIAFGRMLTSMHTPLTQIMPEAAWITPQSSPTDSPKTSVAG
ncbi:MAG: hypothetical protein R3E58_17545 [Phycisphaerae bacterium]|nr:hypothetical protein [Phycisphaerales bacterium]